VIAVKFKQSVLSAESHKALAILCDTKNGARCEALLSPDSLKFEISILGVQVNGDEEKNQEHHTHNSFKCICDDYRTSKTQRSALNSVDITHAAFTGFFDDFVM